MAGFKGMAEYSRELKVKACKMYFEDGKLKEQRSFKNGLKDGIWIIWDSNQTKISEARYKDDLKDGTWYIWHSNGKKYFEMLYEKGEKKGVWYMWDRNGVLISEKRY